MSERPADVQAAIETKMEGASLGWPSEAIRVADVLARYVRQLEAENERLRSSLYVYSGQAVRDFYSDENKA